MDNENDPITLTKTFKDEASNTYSGTVAMVNGTYPINGKTLYPEGVILKHITGYGDDENPGGYYLIASPVGTVSPGNVTRMLDNEYDLYAFDQSQEGAEWRNYKANSFDMAAGQGYLYANSEDVTLVFTGTPYSGDGIVTLVKDNEAEFGSWNLVGNPFTETANIDKEDFYRMNEEGSEIEVAETNTIAPMEGIFVLAGEDGETMMFIPEGSSKGHIQKPEPEQVVLNLSRPLTGSGSGSTAVIDRAIVRFGEGRMLPKFQIRENSTKIYIPMDGTDYAVVNVGRDGVHTVSTMAGVNELPVNFKANENGEYTITVNTEGVKLDYLHLIDNMTGADIDLLANPSYTFTAKTTDYESRFKLVFASVCEDADGDNETFAFISNGNIIVNGEGMLQVIDMTGRIIVSRDAARHVSTNGMPAGVYVLRLINGDYVRTQKIVVR
jgi:hypothetical protein